MVDDSYIKIQMLVKTCESHMEHPERSSWILIWILPSSNYCSDVGWEPADGRSLGPGSIAIQVQSQGAALVETETGTGAPVDIADDCVMCYATKPVLNI